MSTNAISYADIVAHDPNSVEHPTLQPQQELISISADDVLGTAHLTSFELPPPPAAPKASEESPSSTSDVLPAPIASLPDSSGPPGNSADIGPDGSPEESIAREKSKTEFDELNRKWKAETKLQREKAEATRAHWEAVELEEARLTKIAEKERKVVEQPVSVAVEEESRGAVRSSRLATELGLDRPDGVLGVAKIVGAVDGGEEAALKKDGKAWRGLDALQNATPQEDQRTVGDVQVVDGQAVMTVESSVASDPNPSNESELTSLPAEPKTSHSETTTSHPETTSTAPADLPIEHYLASSTSSSLTPPSLTLALFSSKYLPLRRRFLLGFACLGINVLLPFLGGMMAGFGEITAKGLQTYVKETFLVGRVGLGGVGPGSKTALTTNPMPGAFP